MTFNSFCTNHSVENFLVPRKSCKFLNLFKVRRFQFSFKHLRLDILLRKKPVQKTWKKSKSSKIFCRFNGQVNESRNSSKDEPNEAEQWTLWRWNCARRWTYNECWSKYSCREQQLFYVRNNSSIETLFRLYLLENL